MWWLLASWCREPSSGTWLEWFCIKSFNRYYWGIRRASGEDFLGVFGASYVRKWTFIYEYWGQSLVVWLPGLITLIFLWIYPTGHMSYNGIKLIADNSSWVARLVFMEHKRGKAKVFEFHFSTMYIHHTRKEHTIYASKERIKPNLGQASVCSRLRHTTIRLAKINLVTNCDYRWYCTIDYVIVNYWDPSSFASYSIGF